MFRDCAAKVEVVKVVEVANYQLFEGHVKCQLS